VAYAPNHVKVNFSDDEATEIILKDNRNLVGSSENQQLSSNEIKNLRKQGATGEVCRREDRTCIHTVQLSLFHLHANVCDK